MRNTIGTLGGWGAWVIVFGLGSLSSAEAAGWKAGAARVDTTPAASVWMSGYGARTKPSEGVAHPLAAKALALADEGGHKVVFVTCDIIGFNRAFTGRVTERVQSKYGLPREDIALFASHCHTGPMLSDSVDRMRAYGIAPEKVQNNVDYTRELEDKIVNVVGEALGKMEPATLTFGVGRAHFALNRREKTEKGTIRLGKNPEGPTDERVPILRVEGSPGRPLAIVFGYACHNTTLRPDMLRIDADYAGYAQDRVEADNPGAIALFITGCAGDADPHPFGTLGMTKEHGQELGEAVKLGLSRPALLTTLKGPLRSAYSEATIHFAGPTDRASYEKLTNDPNPGRARYARRMVEAIEKGRPIRTEYPYPVQAFALGDQLTMVALAGEVVVDYAIRLQRELGGAGRTLWVAAYANDVFGYVASVRVLKEGGYEGGEAYFGSIFPTPLAEDVESIVVKKATELVEQVRAR